MVWSFPQGPDSSSTRIKPRGQRHVEPAHITFSKNGRGEFAFGALNATMELEYAHRTVFFKWSGFDEGDEINGTGSADLNDDGTIEIELSFHDGDDAVLKARRA
jgi:hypothetical protein